MTFKKSIVSLVAAGAVAMSLIGCGDDTVLETGTYTCKGPNGKSFEFIFNLEKNSWDMKLGDTLNSKSRPSGTLFTLSSQNENTKEYTLSEKRLNKPTKDLMKLSKKGDKFTIDGSDETLSCKKQ
ncbi:MAG: hypothetical protein U9N34_06910 [Candidatus Cloacimonadota bacterium]|nr:hypothetical protein [Candidatus Cloacimonadota bacterium]